MNISDLEKESMVKAMNACYVSELPEPLSKDEERIWVKGLAKVTKCDNSVSYVVVENDGNNKPFVTRDFGGTATIVRIDDIYPTMFLGNDDMPSVRSQKDIVRYLVIHGEDKDQITALMESKSKKDKENIKSMVYRYAIKDMLGK